MSAFEFQKKLIVREHDNEYNIRGMEQSESEGIQISYSKKLNLYFINNMCGEPLDSYGALWEMNQSCLMLYPDELDNLIKFLQEAKIFSNE